MPIRVEGMAPHLGVFDMPTSLAFYRDVLGFTVANHSGPADDFDWVLLKLDDIELMLNTAYDRGERPAAPDPSRNSEDTHG